MAPMTGRGMFDKDLRQHGKEGQEAEQAPGGFSSTP